MGQHMNDENTTSAKEDTKNMYLSNRETCEEI